MNRLLTTYGTLILEDLVVLMFKTRDVRGGRGERRCLSLHVYRAECPLPSHLPKPIEFHPKLRILEGHLSYCDGQLQPFPHHSTDLQGTVDRR